MVNTSLWLPQLCHEDLGSILSVWEEIVLLSWSAAPAPWHLCLVFCGKYEASSHTEKEGPRTTPRIRAFMQTSSHVPCTLQESWAVSFHKQVHWPHNPVKPHKHHRLKVPGCVGTTADGYLVTKGKPSSQGVFTGCLINDSRDLRTHTTAVWVRAESFSHSSSADMVVHRDKNCISTWCQDIVY